MPLYIAQSGDLVRCHGCLTDSQNLKDRATQLLIKYKSGALVTQYNYLTKLGKVECVLRVASAQVPPDPIHQLVNLLDVVFL